MREAVSNNSVMREILRHMCSKPGQHDEKSGYGSLNPGQVFNEGDEYFKRLISEITEEYYSIVVRRKGSVIPPASARPNMQRRRRLQSVGEYDLPEVEYS